ncbi:hypothetical protein QTO34_012008 [Cnephaeus nilssonii]|uniref:Uncharacterized protein n=1 Tax=Cnephaeus nilssonii TaxID=3371016 RepID=A0AA40HBX8_CNENI|nr:hypothetical protein QTO34_012008 [Eptesicus nilssonii]
MIGQKTLYSFFSPSPSPARKRRARSPEPADPGTGVAAVDAAVRRGGDRSWGRGRREGEGGRRRGPRDEESQKRTPGLVNWSLVSKAASTYSKQPPRSPPSAAMLRGQPIGANFGAQGANQRRGYRPSRSRPIGRREGRDLGEFLPRKGHVGTRSGGSGGAGRLVAGLPLQRTAPFRPVLIPNTKFGASAC